MPDTWGGSWGTSWGDSWGSEASVPVEPPTSFPAVVRRLNMLRPARFPRSGETGPGFTTYVADWTTPGNYFKDWLPFNLADEGGADTDTAAFGAFTTAPDGTTNTARLLRDTTANSQHSFIAGWNNTQQWCYGKIRLAGIFKSAGRRVVLAMTSAPTSGGGAGKIGCKAVFDLASGQVAVDTVAFGTPDTEWTLYPAQISAVGDGWYLCIVDALATNNQSGMPAGLFGRVFLDNGSGMDAESSTYAGDGTSGVYGWRANMLPVRAWDMGEVAFFDDFDDPTMANIDLTDSRVEGFDWYIHNSNPSYSFERDTGIPVTDPDTLSVADSILTCASNPRPLFMATFASTWDDITPTSGYVGRGFVIPGLFEGRAKWDISLSNQSDAATMWTASVEYLVGGRSLDLTLAGREYDFFEAIGGGLPRSTMLYYIPGNELTTTSPSVGISSVGLDVWYAAHTYGEGSRVTRLGTSYVALLTNAGQPPESSPTYWNAYSPPIGAVSPYQAGVEWPVGDYTNFHDYATLWLPYDEETGEPGQVIQFYDGIMCSFPLTYGPGQTGNNQTELIHSTDWQQMPVLLGCGPDMGISFDWVRVTQEGAEPPEPEVADATVEFDGGYRRHDYEPERQQERRRKQEALRETVEAAFRAAFGEDEPAAVPPKLIKKSEMRRVAVSVLPQLRTEGLNASFAQVMGLLAEYQAAVIAERRALRRKREEETMLVVMTVH